MPAHDGEKEKAGKAGLLSCWLTGDRDGEV